MAGGGSARGGGWGAVTGAWWVLSQERAVIQDETHHSWYLGRTIQVVIPNFKRLEGIVNDIQVLQTR